MGGRERPKWRWGDKSAREVKTMARGRGSWKSRGEAYLRLSMRSAEDAKKEV